MEESKGAWCILVFAFINHVIMFGITWSSGVFYEMFLNVGNHQNKGEIALVSALNTATFYAAGPLSAITSNMFGNRKVALVGSIFSSSGLILSCIAPNIHYLYFSFGILNGLGLGLVYMPTVSTVCEHFNKYRSLAVGLATSGSAIGLMSFPPMISFMTSQYGWQGALLISGAISCNLFACSLALRPAKDTERDVCNFSSLQKKNEVLNVGVLRNSNYVILCINNVLLMLGISILFVHLSAFATSLGHDPSKGSLLFSMMGVTGFFGRIIYGLLAQNPRIRPIMLYTVGFLLSGLLTLLCPVFNSFNGLLMYAAGYGLFSSCLGTIMPFVITEMLDLKLLNSGYGYLMLFEGIGTVAGGPLAAILYEHTKNYPSSMYLGGSAIVASSLLMIFPWIRMKRPSTVLIEAALDCQPQFKIIEYMSAV